LIDLSPTGVFNYQKPPLQWVNKTFPGSTTLDLDQQSDAVLVQYACRLLEEAEQAVVYVHSESETGFGSLSPLVEQLIRYRQKCLLLLQGQHPRLHRMLSSRPDTLFFSGEKEEELLERVREFWEQGLSGLV
jgi:hypothetical protein